jgi:F-type H+-transporting ATPase subunit beta
MPTHYVYENWHRKRGRIHCAECSYCNHGKGFRGEDSGKHGKWHGFSDRASAFAAAKRMNIADMKSCEVCAP